MYQEKQEENELRALPPASAAHLRALDISIQRTARQNGISEEDFEVRKAVVTRMEEIIRRHLPGLLMSSTLNQIRVTFWNQCFKVIIQKSYFIFVKPVRSDSMVQLLLSLPSKQVTST